MCVVSWRYMALYVLSLCAVLRDRLLHCMLSLRFVNGLIKTLFVCLFCSRPIRGPSIQPANTAREYSRHSFWTPVFTGRVGHRVVIPGVLYLQNNDVSMSTRALCPQYP